MRDEPREYYSERLPDGRVGVFAGKRPRSRSRERQERWDARHMMTVSCRIRREQYERFKAACRLRGTTPYEVLKREIERRIGDR